MIESVEVIFLSERSFLSKGDLFNPTLSKIINNFPLGSKYLFSEIFPIHLKFDTGIIFFLKFL